MILARLLILCLTKLIGKYKLCSRSVLPLKCVLNIDACSFQRMLDMGFEEDVRFIISKCKSKESRQTAMFSATWPAAIQQLALEFMVSL